jgi:glycosyltransferase involved in cell wall biosynthesis
VTAGFHSPLPPARTGVADYAASLLEALRRRGEIKVNSPDAAVSLYHIGNNQLHREIYRRALARPGVIVLHDAVLHHCFLGCLERADYLEEFVFNYGEWNRGLAAVLWEDRAHSGQDSRYFDYPMLRRIAEVSRAVIVHNPAAARMVLRHAPHAVVREVPHLFAAPPEAPVEEVLRLRQSMGFAPQTFVFAVLGYLRESKRLPVVLRAFNEVRRQGVDSALLVAGEFVSSDLARAVEPLLAREDVRHIGHTADGNFWQLAQASDACVNLRHPGAGETSGITVRMMGMRKPVIVSAGEEVSRFPADACLRIVHGAGEKDELVQQMVLLARAPELAHGIGRRAAAHIRERHNIEAVAETYWEILCACRD